MSAQQFGQKGEMNLITQLIKDESMSPDCLEFELTDSSLLQNIDSAAAIMHEMKAAGIHHAIDDFGTGYSSLKSIKQLPINKIKIDRSFITDIISNKDTAAIVSAIIAMAHSMKLTVVAEGVETEEQLDYLNDLGCDQIQGYLLSTPLPSEKAEKLLCETQVLSIA